MKMLHRKCQPASQIFSQTVSQLVLYPNYVHCWTVILTHSVYIGVVCMYVYYVITSHCSDVCGELRQRIEYAQAAGILDWNIIVDPGVGFAKTFDQSMQLLGGLNKACPPGYPVLCGPSRKGFIGHAIALWDSEKITSDAIASTQTLSARPTVAAAPAAPAAADSEARLHGTSAAVCISIMNGADIIRVHDVDAMKNVIAVTDTMYRSSYSKNLI
jgi:dihydropteroate synthase